MINSDFGGGGAGGRGRGRKKTGSDGTQRDGQGSGAAAKRKKTWMHNGVEFSSEPYPWKGKMFFAVSTGGGLESIFVEEGREDDTWVKNVTKLPKYKRFSNQTKNQH